LVVMLQLRQYNLLSKKSHVKDFVNVAQLANFARWKKILQER
jgi:hypothetical protein